MEMLTGTQTQLGVAPALPLPVLLTIFVPPFPLKLSEVSVFA